MIRTYLDSGIIILAFRSKGANGRAWRNSSPTISTGPFVEMETLLHAIREKRQDQMTAYQDYLGSAEWFGDLDRIIETAPRKSSA